MRRPILQSLLLADNVYVDALTGKGVIAGTFNRLTAKSFPASHASCYAYVSMTECTGLLPLQFRLIELATNEVLVELDLQADAGIDPLNTKEFVFSMKKLPFPRPGHYGIGVFWNNEQLGMLRLQLVDRRESESEGKK